MRRAVLLAGGKGSRLAPYTAVLPKPLLPLGDRAIVDIVVGQLSARGWDEVIMSVGHLAHLVRAVLGDGADHGVPIRYHEELEPLGTAAPLREIDGLDETFLMMNGDVLTDLDYDRLLDEHREAGNALTIATHRRVVETDYGVLETEGADGPCERIVAYVEKPEHAYTVSMGVYAVEPAAIAFIPARGPFDLPDLVHALLDAGEPVGACRHDGYWLDIGRPDDYERAAAEIEVVLPRLLPGASIR
jgi:NDP-sugar pyrophosphorylase family protein